MSISTVQGAIKQITNQLSFGKKVTYKVKPSGNRVYLTRHLDGESFVRVFAQHILPPGFRKLRYYGFMSPNCKLQLADARWLAWLWRGWTFWLPNGKLELEPVKRQPPKCERCGGELELEGITGSQGNWLWRRKLPTRGPPDRLQSTVDRRASKT